MGCKYDVQFSASAGNFSPKHPGRLRSTQPRIQWELEFLPPAAKRSGREADRSPPSSAEVKNQRRYNSRTPHTHASTEQLHTCLFSYDIHTYFITLLQSFNCFPPVVAITGCKERVRLPRRQPKYHLHVSRVTTAHFATQRITTLRSPSKTTVATRMVVQHSGPFFWRHVAAVRAGVRWVDRNVRI